MLHALKTGNLFAIDRRLEFSSNSIQPSPDSHVSKMHKELSENGQFKAPYASF